MNDHFTSLQITDRFVVRAPDLRLLKFLKPEWALYDGVPIPHDDRIQLFDILIANMVNAKLDTANKIATIWRDAAHKPVVEACLGSIPPRMSLLHDDVPWSDIEQLLDAFCAIRFVGPAVATKILHKKRPDLIPIIDSVLVGFLLEFQPYIPPSSAL